MFEDSLNQVKHAKTTTSRLRMWWLRLARGYKLTQIRRRPRTGWFGRLTYEETYQLVPKSMREG